MPRTLAEIRGFHHRRDFLGEQDSCRCGQRMPCDVLRLLGLLDASQTAAHRELIEKAREQHIKLGGDTGNWCRVCPSPWPCLTVRLAEALEAAEGREQELLKLAEEKGWGYFFDQRYDNAMVDVVRLRESLAAAERERDAALAVVQDFVTAWEFGFGLDFLDKAKAALAPTKEEPA